MVFAAHKSDPRSMLMFMMLSAFSQFERAMLKERQKEGIAIAKAKGAYKGRRPALTDDQAADLRLRVESGLPKARVARDFGICRDTLYEYIRGESK